MTMGRSLVDSCFRRAWQTSQPLKTGMVMSKRTSSGRPALIRSRASWPLKACSASNPAISSRSRIRSDHSLSSSTTSIFFLELIRKPALGAKLRLLSRDKEADEGHTLCGMHEDADAGAGQKPHL